MSPDRPQSLGAIDRLTQRLFPQLTVEDLLCLSQLGDEICVADGEILFEEGRPLTHLFALLEGDVRVSRRVEGQDVVLVQHGPGNFTGDLSLLTGALASATGRAVGPCQLIRLSADGLRALLSECPSLAATVLTSLSTRTREGEALVVQREKLASLGRMAACLAHEINNPAAAALRAASALEEGLRQLPALVAELAAVKVTPAKLNEIAAFVGRVRPQPLTLDSVTRSDAEEDLANWLDAVGVADAWNAAPVLLSAGYDRAAVEAAAGEMPAEHVPVVAAWVVGLLGLLEHARVAEQASRRICDLVGAVKEYTFMDAPTMAEVDLHAGLNSTLTILDHKLRSAGIRVVRDYTADLPRIQAHGGELNQIWTNLIDNAIDAMGSGGTLTLRTALDPIGVLIEVGDTGPGIPAEMKSRLFEPFFTTKSRGKGTGLGLDMVRRLVLRHGGDVRVVSKPGDTRFQVRLPLVPPGPLET